MKSKIVILVLCCLFAIGLSDDLLSELVKFTSGIGQIVSTTLLKNCTDLKSSLGLTYEKLLATRKLPTLVDVSIQLHTTTEIVTFNFSTAGREILKCHKFNKSLPTIVYLHGYLASPYTTNSATMISSLLKKGGANILILDASKVIFFFYLWASTAVQFIGESLGIVLAALVKGGVDPNELHLIGHSLGAHIAGFSGQTFFRKSGEKIGRISGLDPAGPCFFDNEANLTLSMHDAMFVDVIHTDAGVLGIVKPLGHVDFYPNSGFAQPNALFVGESHNRAWQFYNETIYSSLEKGFIAVKCADWNTFKSGNCSGNERAYMGYKVSIKSRGIFYLKTGGAIPYGLGEAGIIDKKSDIQLFFENLAKQLSFKN